MGNNLQKLHRTDTYLNANLVPIFEIENGEFGSKTNSRQVFVKDSVVLSLKSNHKSKEISSRKQLPKRISQDAIENGIDRLEGFKSIRVRRGDNDDIWVFATFHIKPMKTTNDGQTTFEMRKSPYDMVISLAKTWESITQSLLLQHPNKKTLQREYELVCDYKSINQDVSDTLPGSYVKNHIKCADKSSRFTKRARKKKAALAVVGVGGAAAAAAAALKYKNKNLSKQS
jgi:hypothetical protein